MSVYVDPALLTYRGWEDVHENLHKAVEPKADLTVSRWADTRRVLSAKHAKQSGDWDTGKVPFMREIMDGLSARSAVRSIFLMKGAQVAGTECANNWVGYVVRSHVAYLRGRLATYEHELGAPGAGGTDANGNRFVEQVLYSWATESDGFLSLSDDGAMVTFSRRERTFATDLRNYLDASGKVTNRFTFPNGGRLYAVLTDVRTDAFPAGARDTAGRAKGDAAFDWQGACPCFLAQKFMLAVNGTFIDRYTYGGVYVDRKTLPFGYKATAAPNALATLRWQHVGGPPVSSGAAPGFNSYYLPHSNLLAMPYDSTTGPYDHMASTDEGVTGRRVQIQFYQAPAGTPQIVLNVGAWAGLHPYFPT